MRLVTQIFLISRYHDLGVLTLATGGKCRAMDINYNETQLVSQIPSKNVAVKQLLHSKPSRATVELTHIDV